MFAPGDRPEMTSDQQPEEAEESVDSQSSDNPKCSKYSENKKKCKKKWEKHGCQWAKSPPGEADRCTDYKKMYQACLEIPVREAGLPEVGR